MFTSKIKIGETYTPSQLADLLNLKSIKTNRFIKETNSLIILNDYTKNQPDFWINDTLHLTGTSQISGSTYSKLADSRVNGVSIHLFQILKPNEITYSGPVTLGGDPYTKTQNNNLVWVFPIKTTPTNHISVPSELVFTDLEDYQNRGDTTIYNFLRRRNNYIGYRVQHKEHGEGTIKAFDGTLLTVIFDNNQTKTYHFNKSFQGGHLKFVA